MGYITKNGHTFFIPDVSDKETKPFLHDKKGMPIIKDTYRGYDWKELLKHTNYSGDYFFTNAKYLNLVLKK